MDNQGYQSYGENFGRVIGIVVALILVVFVVFAVANIADNGETEQATQTQSEPITLDVGSENEDDQVINQAENESTEAEAVDNQVGSELFATGGDSEELPNTGAEQMAPILLSGVFAYIASSKFIFSRKV